LRASATIIAFLSRPLLRASCNGPPCQSEGDDTLPMGSAAIATAPGSTRLS
jgi:hypothetical protein